MKKFLHIGCGKKHKDKTTRAFNTPDWQEIRFDIDPTVEPDIVGDMLDMSNVEDNTYDALFSSHSIEHLFPHQVQTAMTEFLRILKPDGYAIITCPDIQPVCEAIAEGKIMEPLYVSRSGPIYPLDMLYGHRGSLAKGAHYMAHKTGFTQQMLGGALHSAGFKRVLVRRNPPDFDLWAVARKAACENDQLQKVAWEHFPRPKPQAAS